MRSARTRLAAGLGLACGGVLAGALALAGFTVGKVHRAHRREPLYTFTPFEVGADWQDVTLHTADGLRLTGWWLERPGSQWVIVVCHGHQGSKADMLGIGPGLWRAGHSVLMFDFRGCGDADPGPQSLAHDEQADLRAALSWVRRHRPDARVGVVGFSMGAATAILVGAGDPGIEVFVLDSPFAEMADVIAHAYRRFRLPSALLLTMAEAGTRWRHGYRFRDVRPVDVFARLAPRPVLLMHGGADRITPVEHAHRLRAAAAGPVEFVIFDGAPHCGGYFQDRPGYIDRVADFIDRA